MKVYWRYKCDFGHEWALFREQDAEEQPEDTICPEGHPAVTLAKLEPIDRAEISFRPAGFLADKVTGQILLSNRYYLTIRDFRDSDEALISAKTYVWEEVVKLAIKFRDLSWEMVKQHWTKMSP